MATYKVFNPQVLLALAREHQKTFLDLAEIETILNRRFSNMEDPILALILAVASGEPLLFVGPPGTAKSRLIRVFCELVGLIDLRNLGKKQNDQQNSYFEYLLTPFTEPGELFGYFNVEQVQGKTTLIRNQKGMMQQAKVVYLDEVFNGSSAILNSILAFVNEGIFHDRGEITEVEMQVLFGATNDVPQTNELRAIYDRFLLRCEVNNVNESAAAIKNLLEKGWQETYSTHQKQDFSDLLDNLELFRKDLVKRTSKGELAVGSDSDFFGALTQRVSHMRRMELSDMSNRRMVKMLNVMLIHSLYEAVRHNRLNPPGIMLSDEQFMLLRFSQDRLDELSEMHLDYRKAAPSA